MRSEDEIEPLYHHPSTSNELSAPVPVRMINEWVFCPRLAYLEHVHREWADNEHTEDGRRVHRRVDLEDGEWPLADALSGVEVARAVWMTADKEGMTARIDLLESVDGTSLVRPIDYKRGAAPDLPEGAYLPERVQVCAQALILRELGYEVEEGALWFAQSRKRVIVPISATLIEQTRSAMNGLREAMRTRMLPPPLIGSSKCEGCSLAPICLPDEIGFLRGEVGNIEAEPEDRLPRRLIPARLDGVSLYVSTPGAKVGLRGEELVVKLKGERIGKQSLPLCQSVSLYGGVQISTQLLTSLIYRGIPVSFFSSGGWFKGIAQGMPHGNIHLRVAQYAVAADPERSLSFAQRFIVSKIRNQRTLLRRGLRASAREFEEQEKIGPTNSVQGDSPQQFNSSHVLDGLRSASIAVEKAATLDEVRGWEGRAAHLYFNQFESLLRPNARDAGFNFHHRNKRPPRDPVNAALSFAYALLVREVTQTTLRVGLEPLLGFLHLPRHGRPALALDLMEEFRPILADSAVLTAMNNGVLRPEHFIRRGPSCNLNEKGRKHLIHTWERRLDQLVTHPVFGYRISYRRVIEVQARLLARCLLGELEAYPGFEVR